MHASLMEIKLLQEALLPINFPFPRNYHGCTSQGGIKAVTLNIDLKTLNISNDLKKRCI